MNLRVGKCLIKVTEGSNMNLRDPCTHESIDMSEELPAPKFKRFERVVIRGEGPHDSKDHKGERGTVVWLESSGVQRQPDNPDQWLYVVHLSSRDLWKPFFQYDLEHEGGFDPESAHLGKQCEICFDTVLGEDNVVVEGCYRLPGEFWKVVIFQKDDVSDLEVQPCTGQRATRWEDETTGVVLRFPRTAKLGRDEFLHAMSEVYGSSDWMQVDGPDSMMLR